MNINNISRLAVIVLHVVMIRASASAQLADLDMPDWSTDAVLEEQWQANYNSPGLNLFVNTYVRRTERIFADRFSPMREVMWNIRYDDDIEGRNDYLDSRAISGLTRGLQYGSRALIAESAEIQAVINKVRQGWEGLGNFLEDSIQGDNEYEYGPRNLVPKDSRTNFVVRSKTKRSYRYGIEVFRPEPYFFAGMSLRHDGRYLGSVTFRYRLQDFGTAHKFEAVTFIPLPYQVGLSMGVSYHMDDEYIRNVIRLSKRFNENCVAFVSTSFQKSVNVTTGFTREF